ncbi:hypothetical protein CJF31_00002611 [Rutstroemia sp. NJR-2017a BVV2]|nr:hypothetical protein CJF31_00002611 [Rutstroemia sp. NJR-2017a BVV2]
MARPLNYDRDEIRLLQILHSPSEDDSIHCHLIHTRLNDAPPYHALSYAWGSKVHPTPIYVNGGSLTVAVNLMRALGRLRPPTADEVIFLWVDAICINQNNTSEKNNQIRKMRTIYQNARGVCVWIGRGSDDSSSAIQLVRELNRAAQGQVKEMLQDPSREEQILSLKVLFRRQYWWRIWVIQEVSCAREVMVYCGPEAIPLPELNNACDILKSEEDVLTSIFYTSPSIVRTLVAGGPRSLKISRYHTPDADEPSLFDLLLSHKSKMASEPKDKVFALVGISSSKESFGPIDYSMSVRQVYTHAAKHIIQTSGRLDVICAKQQNSNCHDLPTWVPDWTRPLRKQGPTIVGLHHSSQDFLASDAIPINVRFVGDEDILITSGVIIDKVQRLGYKFKRRLYPGEDISDILRTLHGWWSIITSDRGHSIDEQGAFCRLISCGNWASDDMEPYAARMKSIAMAISEQYPSLTFPLSPYPMREELDEKGTVAALISVSFTMNRRRFIISTSKIMGLAPIECAKDDLICVLPGCRFPVILRPQEDHHILIGEAYIDGFMFGEAMRGAESGIYEWNTFEIH